MKKTSAKRDLERMNKKKTGTAPRDVKVKLFPVHCTVDELVSYNRLQATEENPSGQYVDPETGLREYSRLSAILRIPEIRNMMLATADSLKKGEDLPEQVTSMVDENPPTPDQLPPIPSDEDPVIDEMGQSGNPDDTKVAMMPRDVIRFLESMQDGADSNPVDKLPQFGWGNPFKSIVRTVATVAGCVIGTVLTGGMGLGLMGAMVGGGLGAYAGNLAGRTATGQPFGKAVKAAVPSLMHGAAYQALSAATPSLAGGTAAGTTAAGTTAAGTTAAAAPTVAGTTAAATPAVSSVAAAPASTSGLLAGAKGLYTAAEPYLLPGALLAGGYMMMNKGEKKDQQQWEKEKKEHDERMRQGNESFEQSAPAFDTSLRSHASFTPQTPYPKRPSYKKGGSVVSKKRELERINKYKKGGSVKVHSVKGTPLKGAGKGQDDLIHQTIPENTWIHDADFVSKMGDGATDAGHKEIHKFEEFIRKEKLPLYKDELKESLKENKPRNVKCAVANGERRTPLLLVGALGEGSFDKGAKIMREIREEVRRDKKCSVKNIPPAAKDLETYYHRVMNKKGS